MFAPKWSASLEYQYYDFGSASMAITNNQVLPFTTSIDDNVHTFKAGVNYHFGQFR